MWGMCSRCTCYGVCTCEGGGGFIYEVYLWGVQGTGGICPRVLECVTVMV